MKHPTACSKSWTDVNIDFKSGKVGHCCKSIYYDLPTEYTPDFFDNSEQAQERRQATLDGIQHPDCIECWRDINSGNASYKDWWNEWKTFDHAQPDVPQVNYIEVELDSTCDLSCLYCGAETSSKIAQEEGVEVQDKTRDYDIEMFKPWLADKINNAKQKLNLNFSGGEPTASKLFYDILDFIKTLDTSKTTIDVITNGNSKPFLFKKFLQAIDETHCLRWMITISNESFGADSELIRYGLDWERFENNVIAYANHEKIRHINFGVSVNNLALPTLPQYVEWVYQTMQGQPATFGFCGGGVNEPHEMDISILPESHKVYIDQTVAVIEKYQKGSRCHEIKGYLEFLEDQKQRISSDYTEDYQTIIQEFLHEKQRVKKTDQLMRLTKPLGE